MIENNTLLRVESRGSDSRSNKQYPTERFKRVELQAINGGQMITMESIQRTELEQVQDEHTAPSVQVEMEPDVSGSEQLHGALGEMADSFDVSGFKCAHEECGLVHTHDSTKHRASDDFDMSESEAASMEANPNCHCGLNELARRGVSGAPSPSRANSMAPIPNEMSRHLDAMF